jgi:hypothetical protein
MKMRIVQDTVTAHTLDVWNYTANASRKTGFVVVIADVTAAKIHQSHNIKF